MFDAFWKTKNTTFLYLEPDGNTVRVSLSFCSVKWIEASAAPSFQPRTQSLLGICNHVEVTIRQLTYQLIE